MAKRNSKRAKRQTMNPRMVRLPADLDSWLEEKAAADNLPKTVADKIREIVAAAREAERQQEQAA